MYKFRISLTNCGTGEWTINDGVTQGLWDKFKWLAGNDSALGQRVLFIEFSLIYDGSTEVLMDQNLKEKNVSYEKEIGKITTDEYSFTFKNGKVIRIFAPDMSAAMYRLEEKISNKDKEDLIKVENTSVKNIKKKYLYNPYKKKKIPFAKGDKFYMVHRDGEIEEEKVFNMYLDTKIGKYIICSFIEGPHIYGKNAFKTKREAQKAVKIK